MLASSQENTTSSYSQATEPAKFMKNEPRTTIGTFPRKSKLQSLISTPHQKEEIRILSDIVGMKTYTVFYEGHNKKSEICVQIAECSTVSEFIVIAIGKLKSENVSINDSFRFDLYFAKKNGKPKSDLPALEQTQLLKECGETSHLYLKAIESKNNGLNRSTTCSSGCENEYYGYRKSSLLENVQTNFKKDSEKEKKNSFFKKIFCCKSN